MGNHVDSMPIISQSKSLVQSFYDLDGAKKTQENFSRTCVPVALSRAFVESVMGKEDEAIKTLKHCGSSTFAVTEATFGLVTLPFSGGKSLPLLVHGVAMNDELNSQANERNGNTDFGKAFNNASKFVGENNFEPTPGSDPFNEGLDEN